MPLAVRDGVTSPAAGRRGAGADFCAGLGGFDGVLVVAAFGLRAGAFGLPAAATGLRCVVAIQLS